ncbi:MAG: LCP family protein [Chloroflexi bacterium]|nr:LCP family protein [Chloroflexota bacterium]
MNQQNNRSLTNSPKRRKQNLDPTTWVILSIFVVVGIILAFISGKFVYNLVKSWSMTDLPGAPIAASNTNSNTGTAVVTTPSVPLQSNTGPAAETWDGKSRVNILLLGLDYSTRRQNNDQGSPLSDTMILVTVDPLTRTIGAMNVMRDYWVNIPGFDYNRINAAYKTGEDYDLPGGGAQLAMDTVEGLLGVKIDFYARVDFKAFETIIDEIGGVPITIQQRMLLDWKGNGNKFWIEPGTYVLPGRYALAYARTRDKAYGEGDIDRGKRQMEVIKAIRDRVLNLNALPKLISRAPAIYNDISAGVQTNMSLDQAVQLAYLIAQIPTANLNTFSPGYTVAEPLTNPEGIMVLRVMPDKLRAVRDQMFTAAGVAAAPIIAQQNGAASDPLALAVQENAIIEILNGSNTADLAERAQAYLQSQGLTNITTGNVAGQESTSILIHKPVVSTLSYFSSTFGVSNALITNQLDANNAVDITVILGNDVVTNNLIP